jgi:carbamoyl-phosphate synthase large subunit
MSKNILFLGGGRRISLAKRYIEKGCRIFSYETDSTAPIKEVATVVSGLKWSSDKVDILDHLISICKVNKIDLIIPLQDPAIPLLSMYSDYIYQSCGAKSLTPPYLTGLNCLNKLLFEKAILNSYLSDLYPTYSSGKAIFKPVNGANSKGLIFKEEHELNGFSCPDNYIMQSCIDGTEYSVDAYFSDDHHLLGAISRVRLEVQGGEVSKSKVSQETGIMLHVSELGKILNLTGPNCIQFIKENNTNKLYIMEVNARFGGGVILSLEAGLPMIEWSLCKIDNSSYDLKYNLTTNLVMSRYFSESFSKEKYV